MSSRYHAHRDRDDFWPYVSTRQFALWFLAAVAIVIGAYAYTVAFILVGTAATS